MHRLSALLFAAASTLALAQFASAADLPMKAPAYKAPSAIVASPWTGFYIGAHVGGAWGSDISQNMNDTNGGGFDDPNFGGATKFSVIGGGLIGYNWQFAPSWVAGVEGDFSWTSLNNSNTNAPATAGGGAVPTTSLTMSNDVRWLASARGRLGYVWDRGLFYVTGGAAWENVAYSATLTALAPFVASTSFTKTNSGWVIGPGVEWLLTPNWTVRAEYLYYSFPGASATTFFLPAPCGGCTGPVNYSWSSGNVQTLRAAISYKF